jgi:hypothetical protein
MTTDKRMPGTTGDPGVCRVVILHETEEALSRANALCDHLLNQHWLEVDLHFERWPFEALQQEGTGADALRAALEASIVVVAAEAAGDFDEGFRGWAQRWVTRRSDHEGALVGLLTAAAGEGQPGCSRDVALHHLALRAGMDYLNHLPSGRPGGIPDETDWCAARASALTGTLSDILQKEPRPHWD